MISYKISENQRAQISSGGVVFRYESNTLQFAVLVRKPGGRRNKTDRPTYHLPKGTLESGETLESAAQREIEEEAGCKVELLSYLGTKVHNLRRMNTPSYFERDDNELTINYFIAKFTSETEAGMDGEHDELLWLTAEEAISKFEGYWKHEDELVKRAKKWLENHTDEQSAK